MASPSRPIFRAYSFSAASPRSSWLAKSRSFMGQNLPFWRASSATAAAICARACPGSGKYFEQRRLDQLGHAGRVLVGRVGGEAAGQGLVAAGVPEGIAGDFQELGALLVGERVQVGPRQDLAGALFAQRRAGARRFGREQGHEEQEMHGAREASMARLPRKSAPQGGGGTPSGGSRRRPSSARTSGRVRNALRSSSFRPRTCTRAGSTAAARRSKATASSTRFASAAVEAAL